MKTTILRCDLCQKEYEENTTTYTSIYKIENGITVARMDLCRECTKAMFDYLDTRTPQNDEVRE